MSKIVIIQPRLMMGDDFDCNLEILELTAGGGGDGGEDEFKPKYFFSKMLFATKVR